MRHDPGFAGDLRDVLSRAQPDGDVFDIWNGGRDRNHAHRRAEALHARDDDFEGCTAVFCEKMDFIDAERRSEIER